MNNLYDNRLKQYVTNDNLNALREIIQEITLYSLSKTDFFDKCAFCGGTALRIFYGLNRASEDLDFSLVSNDESFDIKNYIQGLKSDFELFQLSLDVTEVSEEKNVKSAFLKGNTSINLLSIGLSDNKIDKRASIKIKIEVDTNPPKGAQFEYNAGLFPAPYKAKLMTFDSLFSGKIHAVLARSWNNRVKGRDYFDLLFYIKNNAQINYFLLENALKQTETIDSDFVLDKVSLEKLLIEKIKTINFELAKNDVLPFLSDEKELDFWDNEFFISAIKSYFLRQK